jgi:hypothetical protein
VKEKAIDHLSGSLSKRLTFFSSKILKFSNVEADIREKVQIIAKTRLNEVETRMSNIL